MEREKSDDSYCTTEDGANSNQGQDEEPLPEPLNEKVGDVVKVKEENIIKIIDKVGTCSDKPIEIDDVVLKSYCYYIEQGTQKEIKVPYLCEFADETEVNLSDEKIPRSFALAVQSMRIGEEATFKIKFKYIFKHLAKTKQFFETNLQPLYDSDFQNKYINDKMICKVTLVNFFMNQNLMDKGEIRKKILRRSTERKFNYAKNSDVVTFNLQCIYKNKEIYNKVNQTSEFDKEIDKTLYEIERRILENVKIGEFSMITVQPSYMSYKNKAFLEHYSIDNTEPVIFYCEVFDIIHYEYVYDISKDKVSKSRVLYNGFGRECPDREMLVKLKLQIKIDNKIRFNTFEKENIDEYIKEKKYTEEFCEWRDNKNKEYNIANIDDEIDFEKNSKIYNELNFPGLLDIDMKMYTIPNLMRKVLVHMKRNEIRYVKTSFIDYFIHDNCELDNIGKYNVEENQPKIEIYIHLYDFLQRPLFSKYSYEDKLKEMNKYKSVSDDCFKKGKIFRAMKLYNNLNYRFDEGDIFGHDAKNAQEYLKENNKDIYDQLMKMRISTHNNYALCKLKLGKIYSCYDAALKVINEFDSKNAKALYLIGKCLLEMKEYKKAVDYLQQLVDINKENKDAIALYNEAVRLNNLDLHKERKMFKKMFKCSD